jgi:hypothetical protein
MIYFSSSLHTMLASIGPVSGKSVTALRIALRGWAGGYGTRRGFSAIGLRFPPGPQPRCHRSFAAKSLVGHNKNITTSFIVLAESCGGGWTSQ